MSIMDMMGGAGAPQGTGMEEDLGPSASPSFQEILNMLQAKSVETEDPEEQAALAKAVAAVTVLVAVQSKQEDAAMGTTPAHKFVARQQGQSGGY